MRDYKKKSKQTLGEEIGNSITHGAGFLLSVAAMILMLLKTNGIKGYTSALIFSISLMTLYIMSSLYHAFKNGSKVKRIFRIFDHSAIYLLIGGTYAPVLLLAIGGLKGYIYFAIQWLIIISGILVKVLKKEKSTKVSTVLCLLLGWSGIIVLPELATLSWPFLWLIVSGGIVYSLGVFFYISRFKYAHFIWHFFVLFGTILHFVGIYLFLL